MSDPTLGSNTRPLHVAVVGSGPSAFYAVEALFKTDGLHCRVDVFDRLPTPFGLVRGGVAPDHQKIKSVVRVYEGIAARPGFRFFGNVMIGRDLQVAELTAHYDRVIFAHGNESDRELGIPGEDLHGVHSATEFVGWYNGHPDFADRRFALDRAERVAVIGNGNVAMDVTRILLEDPAALAETDIAEHALEMLRRSSVREVVLIGRRGPAQAAFSPKEIQEIADLTDVDVVVDPAQMQIDPVSQAWLDRDAPRSAQRNVAFLREQAGHGAGTAPRRVTCEFCASPVELLGDPGGVRNLRVERNELVAAADGTPVSRGTGEFFDVGAELVFKAVGYRGVPLPGLPFHERQGIVPNRDGRVVESPDGPVVPRCYVVGWAKRGPTGLIGTNSPDSKATVAALMEDLAAAGSEPERDADAIVALLGEREVDFVSYADWRAFDAWEQEQGAAVGKIRRKLSDIGEMMRVIRGLRG